LAAREGVELLVSHQTPNTTAPFDEAQFGWMTRRFAWRAEAELGALPAMVRAFDPDVVLLAGWHIGAYRRLARERRGRSLRVMAMDNCWRGTLKQWLGVVTAPVYVQRIADVAWIPGERQIEFADKLGFGRALKLFGLYACDHPEFAKQYGARVQASRELPRAFLYCGRLVPDKGIDVLAMAYARYRERSRDPWPLICCGVGPERHRLEGRPGVRLDGFVQPEALPAKLAESGCFILPSRFEPWAVALHEAASAGLVLLASEKVGAAVHLIHPGQNGFLFNSGDTDQLARLMARVEALSAERREAMSKASYQLSRGYTPQIWAETLQYAWAQWSTAQI
jgi:glycosyltransferase involved in cell wall biosynthesis